MKSFIEQTRKNVSEKIGEAYDITNSNVFKKNKRLKDSVLVSRKDQDYFLDLNVPFNVENGCVVVRHGSYYLNVFNEIRNISEIVEIDMLNSLDYLSKKLMTPKLKLRQIIKDNDGYFKAGNKTIVEDILINIAYHTVFEDMEADYIVKNADIEIRKLTAAQENMDEHFSIIEKNELVKYIREEKIEIFVNHLREFARKSENVEFKAFLGLSKDELINKFMLEDNKCFLDFYFSLIKDM